MEAKEYKTLYELEDTYWWYRAQRSIILNSLKQLYAETKNLRLLDAGCGTGGLLNLLNKYALKAGLDIAPEALYYCSERGLGNILQGDVTNLPFKEECFDLVISLDVLYHLKVTDDSKALSEFNRCLKKGGRLYLNLPAYNFLRSSHDEAAHTRERYSNKKLKQKLFAAGFKIEKLTYTNFFLFPLLAAIRLIKKFKRGETKTSDLKAMPSFLNSLLFRIFLLEAKIIQHINLPFGLSIFAICKK
jgi:SAM-dependent methyltransferase